MSALREHTPITGIHYVHDRREPGRLPDDHGLDGYLRRALLSAGSHRWHSARHGDLQPGQRRLRPYPTAWSPAAIPTQSSCTSSATRMVSRTRTTRRRVGDHARRDGAPDHWASTSQPGRLHRDVLQRRLAAPSRRPPVFGGQTGIRLVGDAGSVRHRCPASTLWRACPQYRRQCLQSRRYDRRRLLPDHLGHRRHRHHRYVGTFNAQIDLLAATLDYTPTGGGVRLLYNPQPLGPNSTLVRAAIPSPMAW